MKLSRVATIVVIVGAAAFVTAGLWAYFGDEPQWLDTLTDPFARFAHAMGITS